MVRRLFIVEDTFVVQGHGLVLVPGIIPEGEERFRIGDPILLKKPDGSTLTTQIAGLDLFSPNPRHEVAVMLKGVLKEDVPVGTEVWSVENAWAAFAGTWKNDPDAAEVEQNMIEYRRQVDADPDRL